MHDAKYTCDRVIGVVVTNKKAVKITPNQRIVEAILSEKIDGYLSQQLLVENIRLEAVIFTHSKLLSASLDGLNVDIF